MRQTPLSHCITPFSLGLSLLQMFRCSYLTKKSLDSSLYHCVLITPSRMKQTVSFTLCWRLTVRQPNVFWIRCRCFSNTVHSLNWSLYVLCTNPAKQKVNNRFALHSSEEPSPGVFKIPATSRQAARQTWLRWGECPTSDRQNWAEFTYFMILP